MGVELAANIDHDLLADIIEMIILNEAGQRPQNKDRQKRQRNCIQQADIGVGEYRIYYLLNHSGKTKLSAEAKHKPIVASSSRSL